MSRSTASWRTDSLPARACGVLALLTLLTGKASAQEWRPLGDPFVAATVGVFDDVRGRLVGVSTTFETLEWDGTRWMHRPIGLLPDRPKTMAFDSARGVVVALIDRLVLPPVSETFEFDGNAWVQRATPTAPQPFLSGLAVFDRARGRTVFTGGSSSTPTLLTWEWDGATWTQRNVPGPSRRIGAAMAFDGARGRTVLFGGTDPVNIFGPALNDTWEWDGLTWSQRTPAVVPSARRSATMTFDSARAVCVLFGGGATPDTWDYDGTTWTQWPQPAPRSLGTVVYDSHRNRTVLIGGSVTAANQDVWEWNGSAWTQRFATMLPVENLAPGTAYSISRDRLVLFGDLGATPTPARTWEWDGAAWLLRAPATSPPPRALHAMWSDGNDVFVFGGTDTSSQFLDDTWRFDGITWSPVVSAQRPAAREYPAAAFDPTTGGALLFGGRAGLTNPFGDTWQLTPAGWNQVATPIAPTARSGAAIASDLARGTVLLWGGADSTGARNDTWSWNGVGWQQLTPAHRPAPDATRTMAFEPSTGLIVLAAKPSTIGARLETWVWNGIDWTWFDIPRVGYPLWPSVSAAPGRIRLFDGENLHELALQSPWATPYGAGCPAAAPQLRADDWPRPGTNLTLSSSGHQPAAPALLVLGLTPAATPLGGCTLLVQSVAAHFATMDGFGNGLWPLPIPAQPTLVGVRVFAQAWSLAASAVQATQGIELIVGR